MADFSKIKCNTCLHHDDNPGKPMACWSCKDHNKWVSNNPLVYIPVNLLTQVQPQSICEGRDTCLKHCEKKNLYIPHPHSDPGACYHNDHSDGQYHECSPCEHAHPRILCDTRRTCPWCNTTLTVYPVFGHGCINCGFELK